VEGPLPAGICQGSILGLGPHAAGVSALVELGLVPPDVVTGMTLHLLTHQPRRPSSGKSQRGAIEGGVWVREQVTYHAPMRVDESVTVSGQSVRRFSRKGRRYAMTLSETRGDDGRLIASNCTTGLVSYRREDGLEDGYEGVAEADLAMPGPDREAAANNPCLARLGRVREGEVIAGKRALVSLAMMRQRDAGRDDNPIHTDPEVAKREGLAAPIAGGSHVLSFVQSRLMEEWGPECLLHGAHFDVRWLGQTYAESHVSPSARVVEVKDDRIGCDIQVEGADRSLIRGKMILPLPGRQP
jgi:acyl dehydratase